MAVPPTGTSVAASTDPWAGVPGSPDDPPSLAQNHQLAEAACPRVSRPPFFRIEKAGKMAYILGSRHVSIGLAKQPAIVEAKLRAASTVVFEVAPGDEAEPTANTQSVPEMLGPELWQRYRKLVGPARADGIAQRGPAVAALTMMLLYEDPSQTLDVEIQNLAGKLNKPTAGLESAAFQNAVIAQLLDRRALRASVAGTKDRAEMKAHSEKDIREYCTGVDKPPGFDAEDRTDMREAGYTDAEIAAMEELLVFSRNRAWIPKLETLFANDAVFVVVGADHLRGDKGVLNLLTTQGFQVTRVELTP
ncbi:MAG: TraB/GumN family protein [Kofleriaceae bacterium]|nr:TraB/GumN family protein [Kofleriaceae bacterium]